MWSAGVKSASLLGIAGCRPLLKLGTACGNTNPGSRSGLFALLRYLVHQLVSTVSCMRFVSLPICLAPVAVLLGRVRKGSKFTGVAPIDAKYALMNWKWLISSSVLSWIY